MPGSCDEIPVTTLGSGTPPRLDPGVSLFLAGLMLCGLPFMAFAQPYATPSAERTGSNLTQASQPQSEMQSTSGESKETGDSASISGVVLDIRGGIVTGAKVVLTDQRGSPQDTLESGSSGDFTFARIPPGAYFVLINAAGFEPFKSAEIEVAAQQAFELPKILLPVATARSEVTVRTTEAIAQVQVKAEEKQRILGILPNFYTTFVPDAAPLTTKQKYSLAFHDVFDPFRVAASAAGAGIQQANNNYAGYGQGAAGYGKRFAALYGNGLSGDILSHAVFPALFHQDPRYFYQGTGSFKSRFVHAVSFSVIARSDSGRPMPNYSFVLGDIGSGLLSDLYYPHKNRGVGLVFTNAAIGIGGRAGGTLLREFVFNHLTTNRPKDRKP